MSELPIYNDDHITYKCESGISKHCRLIEEHKTDYKGINVCLACFSKLKDKETE